MRFFAIAAAIVLGAIAIVTSLPHAPRPIPPGHVEFSSSTASPGPAQNGDVLSSSGAVRGDAPWALSSLPECFRQESRRDGPPAFVRPGLPASARRVGPGTGLHVADCVVVVGASSIGVSRGDDRLTIPPLAHLYEDGDRLILDRLAGGREELRVYSVRSSMSCRPCLLGPRRRSVAPETR